MSGNTISKFAYNKMKKMLMAMQVNPDKVTQEDRNKLDALYAMLCKALNISEHSQWRVEWRVEKWADSARKLAGFKPDEVVLAGQNVILNTGANEMLKLIAGVGGTPFSGSNAYIYVGTNNTVENAAQSGVLATGSDVAYAPIDSGYPTVIDREIVYRATFNDTAANFVWNEASIYNGTGANAIAMNRKVKKMGEKVGGTWVIQIAIQLIDAPNT